MIENSHTSYNILIHIHTACRLYYTKYSFFAPPYSVFNNKIVSSQNNTKTTLAEYEKLQIHSAAFCSAVCNACNKRPGEKVFHTHSK